MYSKTQHAEAISGILNLIHSHVHRALWAVSDCTGGENNFQSTPSTLNIQKGKIGTNKCLRHLGGGRTDDGLPHPGRPKHMQTLNPQINDMDIIKNGHIKNGHIKKWIYQKWKCGRQVFRFFRMSLTRMFEKFEKIWKNLKIPSDMQTCKKYHNNLQNEFANIYNASGGITWNLPNYKRHLPNYKCQLPNYKCQFP